MIFWLPTPRAEIVNSGLIVRFRLQLMSNSYIGNGKRHDCLRQRHRLRRGKVMSRIVKSFRADKIPVVLGGGILGVAFVGLSVGAVGLSLGLIGEGLAAFGGMVVAGRFA